MQIRRLSSRWIVGLAAAAALSGAGSALAVDSYVATSLPNLPGGTGTVAYGVNDAGVVVGEADDNSGNIYAFVYMNGQITALPVLTDGYDAQASSINNSNVIVGDCRNAAGVSRPVRWDLVGGQWVITDLGTLAAGDAGFGVATRINNAGQIVGYATADNSLGQPGAYHACLWGPNNGQKMDLGTLDYTGNLAYSQALGINELGDVTGFAYRVLGGPEHGMLVSDRGGVDITPAEQFGLAQWHNINSNGLLGGYVSASFTSGGFRPATYDRFGGGAMGNGYTLVPLIPGLPEGFGFDISDSGRLVGTMFLLSANPGESVFKGFISTGDSTSDLNDISSGLPGVVTEARDISGAGHIVGTATTEAGPVAVLLTPGVPCPADFNGDDAVSVQDIFDFLVAYFAGDSTADVNHDRSVSVQDIFDYLALYFAGCP